MTPQAYKFEITHAHEISGWNIISKLIHASAPNIGGINGGVQSELATLEFKNKEKLEYLHSIIIIIQQEIFLSGETVSTTILLFH